LLYRVKDFNPKKHQVYTREDIIKLLQEQTYGICWDDEAINSGYKRNFQEKAQQELIKILTNYRDNYNIYTSAIPNFFSLDKDLRDLYFLHLHIIERGLAIVHMPLQGRLYSQDRWDAKYNAKVEENWSKRIQRDPNFRPAFNKLSTFRGYLYFNDLTEQQKKLYKEIKRTKRAERFGEKTEIEKLTWIQKVYNYLLAGKLSKKVLSDMCLMEDKKWSTTNSILNKMLKDDGKEETVSTMLAPTDEEIIHSNDLAKINNLIPSF